MTKKTTLIAMLALGVTFLAGCMSSKTTSIQQAEQEWATTSWTQIDEANIEETVKSILDELLEEE